MEKKEKAPPIIYCFYCNRDITYEKYEHVKSKRKTEMYICRECVEGTKNETNRIRSISRKTCKDNAI